MDPASYLHPVKVKESELSGNLRNKVIFNNNKIFPGKELVEGNIALLGLPYFFSKEQCPNDITTNIRNELYKLSKPQNLEYTIIDLGDLIKGKTLKDTLIGLKEMISYLRDKNVFTIVFGGSSIYNLGILKAFNSKVNYNAIEPDFNTLNNLLENRFLDYNMVDYNHLGYQSYFLSEKITKLFEDHANWDKNRLGYLRSDLKETEPLLRNSDFCSISMNSLKYSEAPAQEEIQPNGFYTEEICQIAQYAGISNSTSIVSIFDALGTKEKNGQTGKLISQIIWFIINGYSSRITEDPQKDEHIKKFIVDIEKHSIIFYKSEKTERWWMEIPSINDKAHIIPCTYKDYLYATNQEFPEKWMKFYKKLNFNDKAGNH